MSHSSKKEVRVAAIKTRQMTPDQERRFEAAIDAWLTILVQRHFDRHEGERTNDKTENRQFELRSPAPQ